MQQIELGDLSAVGTAYTKLDELEFMTSATVYEKAVARFRFGLYHTTKFNDELYALHERGVSDDGKVACCKWCTNLLEKCERKMKKIVSNAKETIFFKFDPTVDVGECIRNNNVVRMHPIKDTWLEWDYGKVLSQYVDANGDIVDITDSKGNRVELSDLSDGEIQALSPLLVASKIIKLSSSFNTHIGHKVKGHIMTLPTSSNREIYKTLCKVLPRLDVAEYNRILYLGTESKYSSRIAFRLNAQRHVMRKRVTELYLMAMRQANDEFAKNTRFGNHTADEWQKQVDAYQGDIIAEPSQHAQDIEEMLRGDVAKGWDTNIKTKQTDNRVDAEFTDVMVTQNLTRDPDLEMIKSILHLHSEIQSKDNIDRSMNVQILDDPLNEYAENHKVLHLGFPLLFPLGITSRQMRTTGLMKASTTRRLLCSADGRFARSKPLQFLLMNQKQRHDNNRAVSLRINASTQLSKRFVEFVNSEEFDRLCIAAAANSKGKEARILLAKVRPLVSVCGRSTKWSALERSAVQGKLFSMAQVFTPFSLFVTYSPKALDCELVIRNAAIQLGLKETEVKDLFAAANLNKRVRMVSDNPVAQARAFQHLTRGFCNIILGLPQHNEHKNRVMRTKHPKGLFGTTEAFFGPIEVQHRGTLHLHNVIQIAELKPALLQRFAHDPDVIRAFIRQIDSVVTGSMRGFEHVDMVTQAQRIKKEQSKLKNCEFSSESKQMTGESDEHVPLNKQELNIDDHPEGDVVKTQKSKLRKCEFTSESKMNSAGDEDVPLNKLESNIDDFPDEDLYVSVCGVCAPACAWLRSYIIIRFSLFRVY